MSRRPSGLMFGQRLRASRRQLGLSQAELGAGRYSGSYISHLESGRRTPNNEVVEFLARRLGVSVDELETPTPEAALVPNVAAFEQLIVAARAWHDRDWETATDLGQRAAESALESGQHERYWEAVFVQSQAHFADGEFHEAAVLAQELADHPVAAHSILLRAQALSLASSAYRSSDQLADAISCGARAVEIASSAPPVTLADALMALISAMFEASEVGQQAQRHCSRLVEVADRVESPQARGKIMWTLGTAACRSGDVARGMEFFDRALSLLSPHRDLRLWLRLHRVIATSRLDAGLVEGVANLLQIASSGLAYLGHAYDILELRHAQAQLAVLEGRLTDAEELLTRTIDDPDLAEATSTNGLAHELLAETLMRLGRQEASLGAYVRAAKVYEAQNLHHAANRCWRMASSAGTVRQVSGQVVDK
ncbi:MAG: helix-turn-helix transcriptional regulator [Micropruina sp.]